MKWGRVTLEMSCVPFDFLIGALVLSAGVIVTALPNPDTLRGKAPQIAKGMLYEDVQEMLGEPAFRSGIATGASLLTMSSWLDESGSLTVFVAADQTVFDVSFLQRGETFSQKLRRWLRL